MPESDLTYRTATFPPPAAVPADYAEKAMGSLMQLHSELMEEKERRVDLYRRLMDREQALAELRMYVKILEDRLGIREPAPAPTTHSVGREPPVGPSATSFTFPRRPPPARKDIMSGWKVW